MRQTFHVSLLGRGAAPGPSPSGQERLRNVSKFSESSKTMTSLVHVEFKALKKTVSLVSYSGIDVKSRSKGTKATSLVPVAIGCRVKDIEVVVTWNMVWACDKLRKRHKYAGHMSSNIKNNSEDRLRKIGFV